MGISANVRFSQKTFADFLKLNYPLLADPPGEVMMAYGVYDEATRRAKRAYAIVDKQGVIRFLKIMPKNTVLIPNDELLKEVAKIN